MGVEIELDEQSGASIRLNGPVLGSKIISLSIKSRKTRSFLTPAGWSRARKALMEASAHDGVATFTLAPDIVSLIEPGTRLVFEDVVIGFQEEGIWPRPIETVTPVPLPVKRETLATLDLDHEIQQALSTDSASSGAAAPIPRTMLTALDFEHEIQQAISNDSAPLAAATTDAAAAPVKRSAGRGVWPLAAAALGGLLLGMLLLWPFRGGSAVEASQNTVLPLPSDTLVPAELRARISDLESRLAAAQEAANSRVAEPSDNEAMAPRLPDSSASAPQSTAVALRAQIAELSTRMEGLVVERDDLRNTILDLRRQLAQEKAPGNTNDLLLQLDAANADRARLTAELAKQQNQTSQTALQAQITSLSDQLSRMTADRDEMIHRNDELRDMNLELKGQIATQDMARIDLEKQFSDFKSRIDSLSAGQPTSEAHSNLPGIELPTPQGAFGALAVARNGAVILTEGGYASYEEASDAALAECRRFSNGTRCNVAQVFRDTCAAVARVSPVRKSSRFELQFGETSEDAAQAAVDACSQSYGHACQTIRQVCVH